MKWTKKKLSVVLFLAAGIYCSSIYWLPSYAAAPDTDYEEETSLELLDDGEDRIQQSERNDLTDITLDEEVSETEEEIDEVIATEEDGVIKVGDFHSLKNIVENSSGEIYLELTNHIYMESNITVPAGLVVTVDGKNTYFIDQVYTYRFAGKYNSTITLKNMQVIGRFNYGIIEHYESNGTAVFDNMNYSGPQPYYSSGHNGHMIIKNGGSYIIEKQAEGYSAAPEEFCQNVSVTFDGGSTMIRHALADKNTNAVFYITNGDSGSGYINLINEARVDIISGNYILYSSLGGVALTMEDNTSFHVTAGGFNRYLGHPISNFIVGSHAYFSYKQMGIPHTSDAPRAICISRNLTVGRNSTFLYESSVGIRTTGDVLLDGPRLVSVYGENGAFPGEQKNWDVKNVNAVNYWTNLSNAHPSKDSSDNWPDYMWNTWYDSGHGSSVIGESFSFSGNGTNGITSGGEFPDVLGRDKSTLKQIFKYNTTPKRVVLGNIDPFEIYKINVSNKEIAGNAEEGDLTVSYTASDDSVVRFTSDAFPILYGGRQKPVNGTMVMTVLNAGGLRAAIAVEAQGVLELMTVPGTIYYGEHKVDPGAVKIYNRIFCDSQDEEGRMLIQVLDSRDEESTNWNLMVEALSQPVNGKELLPASALIFITSEGKEYSLGDGAVIAHSEGKAEGDSVEYSLVWEDEQGLLVKVNLNDIVPGEYAALINWSIQMTP